MTRKETARLLDQKISATLKETTQFTHENGDKIAIEPTAATEAIKQLIRDVLQEVKPERMSEDLIRIALNGKPQDAHKDWTPQESMALSKAFNAAIAEMEAKAKELGL